MQEWNFKLESRESPIWKSSLGEIVPGLRPIISQKWENPRILKIMKVHFCWVDFARSFDFMIHKSGLFDSWTSERSRLWTWENSRRRKRIGGTPWTSWGIFWGARTSCSIVITVLSRMFWNDSSFCGMSRLSSRRCQATVFFFPAFFQDWFFCGMSRLYIVAGGEMHEGSGFKYSDIDKYLRY